MKTITKKNDRDIRTIYSIDGKQALHVYEPKKDINKNGEDFLCYLHDRVVPALASIKTDIAIEDNPRKLRLPEKEKFGKMFRVASKKDAYALLTAICKALPEPEKKPETKASAPKKSKKKPELVFKQIKNGDEKKEEAKA